MGNNNPTFFCRVCGLDQNEYPWGEDNDSPTYGICDCCGAEFGYHDCTLVGIRMQRYRWLLNEGKWLEPKKMPVDWSLEEQMKNIPKEYL
jgi:hypothetical protein